MEGIKHCMLKLNENNHQPDVALHIALFKNVKNIRELCDKTIQTTAAFIDASKVLSIEQVLIAVNRSLYLKKLGKNRLNNFYAEILFNLSISRNISESLQQFGIEKLQNEVSANLIVITMDKAAVPELFDRINGDLHVPSNDLLVKTCDLAAIRKIYKTENASLIESKIASKEFLN